MSKLIEIAEPPLQRLETIARQLEETGTVTAATVKELREVIDALSASEFGIDHAAVRHLAYAAEVLGEGSWSRDAQKLSYAAETFGSGSFHTVANQLAGAAESLPQAAEAIERAMRTASQYM